MNVKFDATLYESEFIASAHALINDMLRAGQAKRGQDGLTYVECAHTDRPIILRKSDNTTLYLSRLVNSLIRKVYV